jgi:thiol-disulfide isomerase/thioredoxin
MAMLCLNFKPFAQIPNRIAVGDQLPPDFWNKEYSVYQKGKITKENLKRFEGSPLILDFWATWCSTCLKNFKVLDSATRTLKLPVLLVNSQNSGDTFEKVDKCLSTQNDGKLGLPSILNDTLMQRYFPSHTLPHYVWIDGSGKVQAITGTVPLNWESLKMMASEKNRSKKSTKGTINSPKE